MMRREFSAGGAKWIDDFHAAQATGKPAGSDGNGRFFVNDDVAGSDMKRAAVRLPLSR
jgi:hypothetical protein